MGVQRHFVAVCDDFEVKTPVFSAVSVQKAFVLAKTCLGIGLLTSFLEPAEDVLSLGKFQFVSRPYAIKCAQ